MQSAVRVALRRARELPRARRSRKTRRSCRAACSPLAECCGRKICSRPPCGCSTRLTTSRCCSSCTSELWQPSTYAEAPRLWPSFNVIEIGRTVRLAPTSSLSACRPARCCGCTGRSSHDERFVEREPPARPPQSGTAGREELLRRGRSVYARQRVLRPLHRRARREEPLRDVWVRLQVRARLAERGDHVDVQPGNPVSSTICPALDFSSRQSV